MNKFWVVGLFLVAFMLQSVGFAQGWQKKVVLNRSGVKTIKGIGYTDVSVLSADGLLNSLTKSYTPVYSEKFRVNGQKEW